MPLPSPVASADHKLGSKQLAAADAAFAELGESDNDLSATLSRVGDVLTEEASAIAGLLLAKNETAARARIVKGRETLLPLERKIRASVPALIGPLIVVKVGRESRLTE